MTKDFTSQAEQIDKIVSYLGHRKLSQLSMDVLFVNGKVSEILQCKMENTVLCQMTTLASCGCMRCTMLVIRDAQILDGLLNGIGVGCVCHRACCYHS